MKAVGHMHTLADEDMVFNTKHNIGANKMSR